jgi:hypothetical protein
MTTRLEAANGPPRSTSVSWPTSRPSAARNFRCSSVSSSTPQQVRNCMVCAVFKGPVQNLEGAALRPPSWASASRRTRSCITGTCSRLSTNCRSSSSATTSPPSRSSASGQGHSPALPHRLRQRHPGGQGSDQDEKPALDDHCCHPGPRRHPHAVQWRVRCLPHYRGSFRASKQQSRIQQSSPTLQTKIRG